MTTKEREPLNELSKKHNLGKREESKREKGLKKMN